MPTTRAAWDDPGRLVESFYHHAQRFTSDEADSIVLTWLAVLPRCVDPPSAAGSLLDRLVTTSAEGAHQRRVRALLRLVAAARPRHPQPMVQPN